jgi:hypothetical protein
MVAELAPICHDARKFDPQRCGLKISRESWISRRDYKRQDAAIPQLSGALSRF